MTKKRKFTAYLITLIVTAVLNVVDGLTGAEFAGLIKVALTVFVVGNGVEHYCGKNK
jgi:hypothetical protein